jgi:hypothetical protein
MSRRNDISVLCGAAVLALAAAPTAAAPKPVDSWGRAGIDYETYRNDSLECGLLGHYADVSQTEQAQMFVRATRQMETVDSTNFVPAGGATTNFAPPSPGGAGDNYPLPIASPATDMMVERARQYEQIRSGIRPERRMDELKQGMVSVVEQCLQDRGYVRFRLTEEQRRALRKLDRGSDERREYLFQLASNPAVLEAQALTPEAS